MFGGGKFVVQNKILPGAFYRFLSASKDSIAISDRGNGAVGLELNWGASGRFVKVESADFQSNSEKIFGYAYMADENLPMREFFKKGKTLYFYRLNGEGARAHSPFGTALYAGTRGNDIKVVVVENTDLSFTVETYLGTRKKDSQTVANFAALVPNDFIGAWSPNVYVDALVTDEGALKIIASGTPAAGEILLATASSLYVGTRTLAADLYVKASDLVETAGTLLSGGTNSVVDGAAHQSLLDAAETVPFHAIACNSLDSTTIGLYTAWIKRMTDEVGRLGQLIVYDIGSIDPDAFNTIVLANKVTSKTATEYHWGIFWTLGAHAGVSVNKSVQNTKYDGELTLDTDYTQSELEDLIESGKFAFHDVGDGDIRVLADINSFVTLTEEEQGDFKNNQTIRVLYQGLNDIQADFNKNWLGITPNDQDGRDGFKGAVIKYWQSMEKIRAIQNFDPDTVEITAGEEKGTVLSSFAISATNAMFQLYTTMTVK